MLLLLNFLPISSLALDQIKIDSEIRPLPGMLDDVVVVNSNSPELVLKEGILLSTFPAEGMSHPEAHLNYPLPKRFDVFAHHVAKGSEEDLRTLYLGIILFNPGKEKVKVDILSGASYLSQPDAPFIPLKPLLENKKGDIYAGPGDRVSDEVLRGQKAGELKKSISLLPGKFEMLLNLPIPVRTLTPHLNGRSSLFRLQTNGTLYAASLAMFAPNDERGNERAPTLAEWISILKEGSLCEPRDKSPSPLGASGNVIYGRVAGVAKGSTWSACLSDPTLVYNPKCDAPPKDPSNEPLLPLPEPGSSLSYPISTIENGTFGTKQIQSAPLLARYPDTAYRANGNYGIEYKIKLPLVNTTANNHRLSISLQNPLKNDNDDKSLSFYSSPPERVHFRGTVQLKYKDETGKPNKEYVHLVARQGEEMPPLLELDFKPGNKRTVELNFIYPADATPPQMLLIKTVN
ncbi:MAG: DUF3370 domain-containing protein [Candidatus Obscuribacterales bacterium]|nr:DUF3370 domain-containing protein [Candidatus Obscuribacterales bacterium]